LQGEYSDNVRRGLEFLLREQANDGSLAGKAEFFARMYCHGMAAFALGEAFALTSDERLKPSIDAAVAYSVRTQIPASGGWRYQPGDAVGDMSQFGWQIMGLRSAAVAGVPHPDETRRLAVRFLNSCSSGNYGGLSGYRPGEAASRTMTAEALACRQFLSLPLDKRTVDEATSYLLEQLPGQGEADFYYWYYATLALRQAEGPAWPTWNRALQRTLAARQKTAGALAGSWDSDTRWGGYGGRAYSTAMAALCLESYYRYLPSTAAYAIPVVR
jgi:hypothetical protein